MTSTFLSSLTTARLIALLVVLCLTAGASETHAANRDETQPLLQADALSYDEETNVITAEGNVEVTLTDKKLKADSVTFNRTTNVVTAVGHVALTETSGAILFADQMELTTDVRQGFIDKVAVLFPDNARLVALDAQRYAGRYLIAENGVYSSCNLCEDDPTKPPLWQFKGSRVTHDSEAKNVIYRNAVLEFWGVPVFYVPYFSHPDPTVKRRQGFLTPSGGMENTLGTVLRTPYYFDIAPNSDLVLTPTFSTQDKLQVKADWRHRFVQGETDLSTSLTYTNFVDESGVDKGKRWRGHLFADTKFDLTNTWRMGSEIALTTDKSYLPRYAISDEQILINRGYVEHFKGRDYGVMNMYYFQDLRPGDRLAEPLVLPEIRYSAFGEPNKTLGGRWALNAGLLVTSRSEEVDVTRQGASTRRLSLDAGWERQFVSGTGFLTTVSGQVRADSYWADNVPDPDVALGTSFSNVQKVRPFGQANISLRYPLSRQGDGYKQLLEPIAVVSIAPRLSSLTDIPNEDSLDVEFDETNLFSTNRFGGIDRLEGGTRVAYGIRHALTGDHGGRVEMVGGQVFRLKKDNAFDESSGLNARQSDYVGRIDLSPNEWFNANYGFRMDHNDFDFARQEAEVSAGVNIFRPSVNFLSTEQMNTSTNVLEQVEEISYGFSSRFAKYWEFSANHKQAINPEPGPRYTHLSLTYQDECFTTGIAAKKDHTNRLDVEAGESIMFKFYLKNIGGLSTE